MSTQRRRSRRIVFILVLICAAAALALVASSTSGDYRPAFAPVPTTPGGKTDVTFVAFGDPQFGGPGPNMNDHQVAAIHAVEGRVRWRTSGELVRGIRGVIIAGDLTEHAWLSEYREFLDVYGLRGEKQLRYPVYEGYGNHDFTHKGAEPIVDSVSARNGRRPDVVERVPGADGHYAWEWDQVHFVHLNLAPTDDTNIEDAHEKKRYESRRALTFLEHDLAKHVRGTKKRVVLVAHYGFHQGWDVPRWWRMRDADRFRRIIRQYRITTYIHGHDHGTCLYAWGGMHVLDVGSPFYTKYNYDKRGHVTIVRITDTYLDVQDIGWDPLDPGNPGKFTCRFSQRFWLGAPGVHAAP